MIKILSMLVTLFIATHELVIEPCSEIFEYEPEGTDPVSNIGAGANRWYGVVNVTTDTTLYSLWLNIILDSKASLLGNWMGDVTTSDNTNYKIENTKTTIFPNNVVSIRFFVQYGPLDKPPRLQAIRLNGREICNVSVPQPAVHLNDYDVRSFTPDEASQEPPRRRTSEQDYQANINPQSWGKSRSPPDRYDYDNPRPYSEEPTYRSQTRKVYREESDDRATERNVNPYSFRRDATTTRSITENRQIQPVTPQPTQKPVSDEEDDEPANPSDYFNRGSILLIPRWTDSTSEQCGKVRDIANPLVVEGQKTVEGQWPWQIALYHAQTVDSKYICGGSLVSHKHVITAAHCVTLRRSAKKVSKNTLTVYLGKHNLRTTVDGVEIRYVSKITTHPDYNAMTYNRDIGILHLRQPVEFTELIRPVCLWPKEQADLNSVIGKKGSVVGWGTDGTGRTSEELMLVEMEVIDNLQCLRSYSEFFLKFVSEFTYCAGNNDGSSVCNGDSGGGMVFNIDGTWYLRGITSISAAKPNDTKCDTSHYAVFTDIAKMLNWINQQISS